jgi:NAD(P)-dependent dehydrogenase (short-subunit alcohol dehydrogenase family)
MLANKSIVIIGGTTGLGLSALRAFHAQGAQLVVVGRNAESCEKVRAEFSQNVIAISADATHPDTAKNAIKTAQETYGAFHGIYHVAGGSGRSFGDGPLHELTLEGWNKTLELNLTSIMLSSQAAVQAFLAQGTGGAILNLGSVLGYSPSPTYFSTHAYAASKAAIIGFSKSIAAYYAHDGIRVNVLAPALVETPMAQRAAQNDTILHFIKTKQPLDGGRIGTPSDLDGMASLALSDASKFMTGQVIAVDGGWTVSEGQI